MTVEDVPHVGEEMPLGFSQLSPCWNLGKGCEVSRTVRPNKPKCQSLEQRKIYCRAKQGEQAVHAQKDQMNSPVAFMEEFLKTAFGLRAQGA